MNGLTKVNYTAHGDILSPFTTIASSHSFASSWESLGARKGRK